MKIYLIDDDSSVCNVLKIIIEQQKLGTVCGMAGNGLDALEDLKYISPDVVVADLLMPIMDGISFVEKAKAQNPEICFVMLSHVTSKELVAKAYGKGVAFFIHKPVNGVEVVQVLRNVIENIQMRRTFNQMQTIFMKDTAMVPAAEVAGTIENMFLPPQPEEKAHVKKLRNTLQLLGISGEGGSADIIALVNYMIEEGGEPSRFTVAELCSRCSAANPKSMEQRVRRAVAAGLTNIAHMGVENYSNDTFHDFAGTLYSFEQVRREMDFIRGKTDVHGKVSIKTFLNALMIQCTD